MQRGMRRNLLIGTLLAFSCAMGLAGCGGDKSRANEEPRQSQASRELCDQLSSTIDRNIVAIAFSEVEARRDKSAVQQSARGQDNANRLSVIALNVQLQSQNKCTPRSTAIDPSLYTKAAWECVDLRIRTRNVAEYRDDPQELIAITKKADEACDVKKWKAEEEK